MKKLLLTMLGVLMALPMLALEFTFEYEGQTLKYLTKENAGEVAVSMVDDTLSGDVVIPEKVTYDGTEYSVTSIGGGAFAYCRGLTSITIPDKVTSIGYNAFRFCSGLTSVTIPNSVTSIAYAAFYGCSGLTSVTIPDQVTSIGGEAFADCSGLTSVIIGNSVTSIGDRAFYGFNGLTSVTIPNSVTSIGNGAFKYCNRLRKAEFASIESLCKIEFGDDYSNPLYLTHNLWIAGEEVKDVVIPETVTSIGNSAFSGCSDLTSVTIPSSVTSIGNSAFSGCSDLTSVTIPSSVTSIGEYAFYKCISINKIVIGAPTPPSLGENCFYEVPNNAKVYVPYGCKNKYMVANGWGDFSIFKEMGQFELTLDQSRISLGINQDKIITATISKGNDQEIVSSEWISSNPDIASVSRVGDNEARVIGVADGEAEISYNVVDGYGLTHTTICKVLVGGYSGIDIINPDNSVESGDINYDEQFDIYSIGGMKVNDQLDHLAPGIYIVRQGNTVKKIAVK